MEEERERRLSLAGGSPAGPALMRELSEKAVAKEVERARAARKLANGSSSWLARAALILATLSLILLVAITFEDQALLVWKHAVQATKAAATNLPDGAREYLLECVPALAPAPAPAPPPKRLGIF